MTLFYTFHEVQELGSAKINEILDDWGLEKPSNYLKRVSIVFKKMKEHHQPGLFAGINDTVHDAIKCKRFNELSRYERNKLFNRVLSMGLPESHEEEMATLDLEITKLDLELSFLK